MSKSFIPLTTTQGLSTDEIKQFVQQRNIIIWGCGHLGRVINHVLSKSGLTINSFCDNNPRFQGHIFEGIKVMSPSEAIQDCLSGKSVLIIASVIYRHEMESECKSLGLKQQTHFMSYISIPRPEVSINLISEVSSSSTFKQQMPFDTYNAVLTKLNDEIPLLSHVSFSVDNGIDPMRHSELANLISITKKKTPCSVVTPLSSTKNIDAIIQAEPSQFVVSIHYSPSLHAKNIQQTNLEQLKENLQLLSHAIEKHKPKTEVKVMYHLYKDNQGDIKNGLADFCSSLNLKFVNAMAYLMPYEAVLRYKQNKALSQDETANKQYLAWKLEQALSLSDKDKGLPCLCQRIFPIINADLSVTLCEVYASQKVTGNFLHMNIDQLIDLRHDHNHCRECQRYGLHRLDIDILQARYPDEKPNLLIKR